MQSPRKNMSFSIAPRGQRPAHTDLGKGGF